MLKKTLNTIIILLLLYGISLADNEAIWGDYKIKGENGYSSSKGRAIIYVRQDDTWVINKIITAKDGEKNDQFGYSVAIHNDFAVVGAIGEDSNADSCEYYGAAYIFQKDGNTWVQILKIVADDRGTNDYFGCDVSIFNEHIIVGAYRHDGNNSQNYYYGAAYIFKKEGNNWRQIKKLKDNSPNQSDYFGHAVAINDTHAVVGAYGDDRAGSNLGAIYIYLNQNDEWNKSIKIDGSVTYFGKYVTLIDNVIIVKNYSDIEFYYPLFNTISGYIKTPQNQPQVGVSITFTNEGGSTSTDKYGYFTHEVPIGWSGIAKPEQAGYKFSPSSLIFHDIMDNAFDQHFTAQRLTITGYIKDKDNNPVPNVRLLFSNHAGETKTDAKGYYIHNVDYRWTGTITPQLAGVDFAPELHTYSDITDNQHTQNFISTPRLYHISGYITDVNQQPLQGTRVCDGETCVESNGEGYYEFIVPYMHELTVIPEKKGYSFSPEPITYTQISEDKTETHFTATIHQYVISGSIQDPDQQVIPGTKIKVNDGEEWIELDDQGQFKLEKPFGWQGILFPEKIGYAFNPQALTVSSLSKDMPDNHITGDRLRIPITGHVNNGNDPIENVRIKFSELGICTTNSNGDYRFDVPYGWSGKVEIFKLNYDFVPVTKSFDNVTVADVLDFVAYEGSHSALMAYPDYHEIPCETGSINVSVYATPDDLQWNFDSSQSWVHMTAQGQQLSITYDKNPETTNREATILIQAKDATNSPQQITIIQAGTPIPQPGPGWDLTFQPEHFQYQQLITAIVQDDQGDALESSNSLLAAFCDNELRGVASPIETSFGVRFFMQVFSNEPSDEEIQFMFYDTARNEMNVNIKYPITFSHTTSLGHVMSPHCLTVSDYFVRMALNRQWNWVSINAINQDMSVNHVLASIGDKGIRAIQKGFSEYVPKYKKWMGDLETIDPLSMILIKTTDPVIFEFSGNALDLPNTPIALTTGWNRLAYLPSEEMPIKNALQSINGNALKISGQHGFAEYVEGHGWYGSLQVMYPNRGYLIRMQNEDILYYPKNITKRARTRSLRQKYATSANGWSFDPSQFEHQATITAIVVIDQQDMGSSGDSLVAFSEDECRGIAKPVETPEGIRYFLQIWSNDNDLIQFKFFDASDEKVYELTQTFEFKPNLSKGNVMSPERLDNGQSILCDLDVSKFQYQGTIIANVTKDGAILNHMGDHLMAQLNDECRGFAEPIETPYGKRYFLHVWGNSAAQMEYHFYHGDTDTQYTLPDPLNYTPNIELGSVENPIPLEISSSNCDQCEQELEILKQKLSATKQTLSQTEQSLSHALTDLNIAQSEIAQQQEVIDQLTIHHNLLIGYTMDVSPGWYLMSGPNTIAYPKTVPDNCIQVMYIYADNRYEMVDYFPPRQGVWVKFVEDCQFTIEGNLE
jgi:hypothetical protein